MQMGGFHKSSAVTLTPKRRFYILRSLFKKKAPRSAKAVAGYSG